MIEALWSIAFVSSAREFGAGVVVLETGRVLGGDSQYTYIGTYKVDPLGKVTADVTINHYAGPGYSIFGPAQRLRFTLEGKPEHDAFTMSGNVTGQPNEKVTIRFTRRAELPT